MAMDLFPDGAHVRLRSRAHGVYLCADEDGHSVSWGESRASLNAAWAVHRLVRGGASYVLLHGAAYGKYLGLGEVREDLPRGQGARRGRGRACRVLQRAYVAPEQGDILWEALEAEDGSGGVVLRHRTRGVWRYFNDPSTVIIWTVEVIPPRQGPPELPLPPAAPVGGPINAVHQPVFRRRIQYVRANAQGGFNNLVWGILRFDGRSVFQLRRDLANELGEEESGITLCVRAGSQGRRTPLVINLPSNKETMEIIVLTTESEGAKALVYPDVDAQQRNREQDF